MMKIVQGWMKIIVVALMCVMAWPAQALEIGGVEFVSVCTPWSGDSAAKAQGFVEQYGVPWTMTFDEGGTVTKSYEMHKVGDLVPFTVMATPEDEDSTIIKVTVEKFSQKLME